jgi:hypothetical protein
MWYLKRSLEPPLLTSFAKMFDLAPSDIGWSNRIYSEDEILVIQSRYSKSIIGFLNSSSDAK